MQNPSSVSDKICLPCLADDLDSVGQGSGLSRFLFRRSGYDDNPNDPENIDVNGNCLSVCVT